MSSSPEISSRSLFNVKVEIDPDVLEQMEKDSGKEKSRIERTIPVAQDALKTATDVSIKGSGAASQVLVTVFAPEVASIVNPVIDETTKAAVNIKKDKSDPLIDKSVAKTTIFTEKQLTNCKGKCC